LYDYGGFFCKRQDKQKVNANQNNRKDKPALFIIKAGYNYRNIEQVLEDNKPSGFERKDADPDA